jgi:hypothetical protein
MDTSDQHELSVLVDDADEHDDSATLLQDEHSSPKTRTNAFIRKLRVAAAVGGVCIGYSTGECSCVHVCVTQESFIT